MKEIKKNKEKQPVEVKSNSDLDNLHEEIYFLLKEIKKHKDNLRKKNLL